MDNLTVSPTKKPQTPYSNKESHLLLTSARMGSFSIIDALLSTIDSVVTPDANSVEQGDVPFDFAASNSYGFTVLHRRLGSQLSGGFNPHIHCVTYLLVMTSYRKNTARFTPE